MPPVPAAVWRNVLHTDGHAANHLLLTGPDQHETIRLARRLWPDSARWAWLYGDGRTLVFGHREYPGARTQDPFAGQSLDLERLAFGPSDPPSSREPPEWPRPTTVWTAYFCGVPGRPLAADEAYQYLAYYDEVARQWPFYGYNTLLTTAWPGPFVAGWPGASGWVAPAVGLTVMPPPGERGPAPVPLLAVRAAWRAVRSPPERGRTRVARLVPGPAGERPGRST